MPFTEEGWVRQNALYEAYIEAQEAATVSDFANFLAEKLYKILLADWAKAPSVWRAYLKQMPFSDFKTHNVMTPLGESDDLLKVPEGGPYHDSQLEDSDNITMKLATWGRTFSISRQAIINDEFNKLQDQPARFGRSAARTLAKNIVSILETPGNAYDAVAFFGNHLQIDGSTTAANNALTSSALDRTTLRTAVERMRGFKDKTGNRLGIVPAILLVPIELEFTAREILGSPLLIGQGASAAPVPALNVMSEVNIRVEVDPYLTSGTTWYLFADPNTIPAFGVGFLNGKDTPDLMLKDPAVRLVLGGADPYSFEFDEIVYKVRHDWITKPVEPRGAIKATA